MKRKRTQPKFETPKKYQKRSKIRQAKIIPLEKNRHPGHQQKEMKTEAQAVRSIQETFASAGPAQTRNPIVAVELTLELVVIGQLLVCEVLLASDVYREY